MSEPNHSNDMYDNTAVFFEKPFDVQFKKEMPLSPLQSDGVMVESIYSLISPGTELALYTGTHVGIQDPENSFAKYPFFPGYANVGTVVKVGSEAEEKFSVGDIVYTLGKHARYNVMSTKDLANRPIIKIRDNTILERIVFARLAAITMTSVVMSNIRVGDTVVVIGMGIIGNLAAQLYALQGAEVIAVDIVEERLLLARQTGIQHTILSEPSVDLGEQLFEITGKHKADIVVEATGAPQLIIPSLDLVKYLGQVIALGSTRGNVDLNIYEHIHCKGVRFIGAHENLQDRSDFICTRYELTQYILRLLDQNIVKVDPLITHKLHYTEAQSGYELLLNQTNEAMGVLLKWDFNIK